MTTSLNAVAGPSKFALSPTVEPASPEEGSPIREVKPNAGVGVDENGELVKVPAFLNKLFSMVSDHSTDELIYWSDSGESFFVPNHERFGKELLPRFFKHSNFSSFVRQLNMYGFHKVPHLQSGVLKNDAPSELWEFVNPYFKRNQHHLLVKVSRKNNRPGMPQINMAQAGARLPIQQGGNLGLGVGNVGGPFLITDGSTEGESGMVIAPTGQQMLDLSALTSNLAALRQTQATIGADLKALKTSNEHLWREALESRDRHDKHQETIDLIVTFLERLFGTEGQGLKGLKEALRRGALGRPREDSVEEDLGSSKKRRRLGVDRMISDGGDANGHGDEDGQIVELSTDRPNDEFPYALPKMPRNRPRQNTLQANATPDNSSEPWSSTSQRFTTLPSDGEPSPFIPSASTTNKHHNNTAPSGDLTLAPGEYSPASSNGQLQPNDFNALTPYAFFDQNQDSNQDQFQHQNQATLPSQPQARANGNEAVNGHGAPLLSPTNQTAQAFNLDPSILQTTIGSLLQSPAAAQMFLQSLNNSVQGQALATPSKQVFNPNPNDNNPNDNNINPPSFPFDPPPIDPTLALFSPLPNNAALLGNNDALLKSYQDAENMNADVDKLQESIDSLVRSMGLDLPMNQNQNPGQGQYATNGGMGMGQGMIGGSGNGNGDGNGDGMGLGSGQSSDFGPEDGWDVNEFLQELEKGEGGFEGFGTN